MIDRVVARWAAGCSKCRSDSNGSRRALFDGSCCFGGEESAGASFLRRDGTRVDDRQGRTDPRLLAAEITARTGKDPGEHYATSRRSSARLLHAHRCAGDAGTEGASGASSRPSRCKASSLAGEPITAKLTRAPGNDAPIGGLKVVDCQRLVRCTSVRHGICTRSMPRASTTSVIWRCSSPRRNRSCRAPDGSASRVQRHFPRFYWDGISSSKLGLLPTPRNPGLPGFRIWVRWGGVGGGGRRRTRRHVRR